MKAKEQLRPEIDLRDVEMKYGRFVVFIRRDSAEIWAFRYGLTIGIGTPKIMASTGVFVRVLFALKRSIRSFSLEPCTILTYLVYRKSHSHQKMGPEKNFTRGGYAQKKQNTNREQW